MSGRMSFSPSSAATPDGTFQAIDLGARTFVRAPITDGVIHIHALNPHYRVNGHHGILLAE